MVLRLGGILLLIGGSILLGFAFVPVGTGGGAPLPVPLDAPVRLPSPGLFGSTLVLYGRSDGRPLAFFDQARACKVNGADGRSVGSKFSSLDVVGKDQRRIGPDTLSPLATVRGFPTGSVMTCSGPAVRAAQPLYLIKEGRRPIPRALAVTGAALVILLGAGALALLRVLGGGRVNPD